MSLAATVKAMAEAGCSPLQIAAVVSAHEVETERKLTEKRAKDAARKRKQRANDVTDGHAESRGHDVTDADSADKGTPSLSPFFPPPTTPPYNPPNPSPPKHARERASRPLVEFENEFWPLYPNKVGKDAARKSWEKAVGRAPVSEIMAGLRQYAAKTDDRPWCNPATWLNQGRWADEPASAANVLPLHHDPPKIHTEAEKAAAAKRWADHLANESRA